MDMNNPLLDFTDLPLFDRIRPEHVGPAVKTLLAQADAALTTVTEVQFPSRWKAISGTLDVATERLNRAWSAVSHLNSVADTPALRAAYNEALPLVTEFWTRLGSDERLYAKYKAIDVATLDAEQRQAHRNAVRNFVLSGADLTGADKDRFAEIQARQAEISQKFSENALDATDAFSLYVGADDLHGVPEDVQQAALAAAQVEGKPGYKLTLKMPSYLPVMQFARSSSLRQKLYRAYTTRASDQGDPAHDNTAIIRETLALRDEGAHLLGYANYAEVSLVPKMARSPEQVIDFLRDLARRARPFAERDLADMRSFAAEHLGLSDPQPWDWSYVGEKLKEARYAFSDEELRQYFTVPRVLAGLFDIIERLFQVRITEAQAEVWHDSVRFYRLDRDGALVGQFYLDLYARPGKRPGAWMDEVRSRWARPEGRQQTPVAQLVCNFASGVGGKPALLTHDDVITLFHEFGHGLHHLLTQVDELGVSGISGVEWDAVELPSQFMENFCWEWEVLQQLTCHVDSAAALPRDLFDKMLAAKNFQSGMQTLRQIEFSLFDMRLHAEPGSDSLIQALLDQIRAEVAIVPAAPFNRSQHSFSHIFAGGYSAGYYSYKWAELLSADAWSAFEVEGVFNADTGQRYLHNILEVGGSRDAMDSFMAFRGREPTIDALLRHQGMA